MNLTKVHKHRCTSAKWKQIYVLRHSRRFFGYVYVALLPAAT